MGIVKEIQIFVTILTTLDNQRIIIPNGLLSNGCLTNLNAEPHRRVDMVFGISYRDDVLHAKRVLQEVIASDSRVLAEPASEVYVKEHAESSINMLVRVWVKPENYWGVYFHMHEQVKLIFDREGIIHPLSITGRAYDSRFKNCVIFLPIPETTNPRAPELFLKDFHRTHHNLLKNA